MGDSLENSCSKTEPAQSHFSLHAHMCMHAHAPPIRKGLVNQITHVQTVCTRDISHTASGPDTANRRSSNGLYDRQALPVQPAAALKCPAAMCPLGKRNCKHACIVIRLSQHLFSAGLLLPREHIVIDCREDTTERSH